MTIDMKSYAGELETPAAVEQQPFNSYERNEHEFPVLPPETQADVEAAPEQLTRTEEQQSPEDSQALNFKALSESVERLKADREAEKREYQLQLDMLRANVARNQVSEPQRAKKMFDGMDDNDVPNVGELRKAWEEREASYHQRIEELQVQTMHPDYEQVLTKYGKQLAETDPLFISGINTAQNKAAYAYKYAKDYEQKMQDREELQQLREQVKQYSKPSPTQQSINAQKIVENARKPGTLAQTGGQSVLSKKDYYETMSDKEFMKMAAQYLEAI